MSSPPTELTFAPAQWEQMRADVSQRSPEEACGMIAGKDGRVMEIIPAANALHSPVRYRIAPEEQWAAFQRIEANGWELLAIYHSHPSGPSTPSATDIAEAFYPETAYLIWSPLQELWHCRAYTLQDGKVDEIRLSLMELE